MADATNAQILPALSPSDINTAIDELPRVQDLRLAIALGFKRPADIRPLIERHEEALKRLGAIFRTVRKNRGRGRPSNEFWLTKKQAVYLTTKSETDLAVEATIQVVEVFDAATTGQPTAALPARPAHQRLVDEIIGIFDQLPPAEQIEAVEYMKRKYVGIALPAQPSFPDLSPERFEAAIAAMSDESAKLVIDLLRLKKPALFPAEERPPFCGAVRLWRAKRHQPGFESYPFSKGPLEEFEACSLTLLRSYYADKIDQTRHALTTALAALNGGAA